MALSLTHILDLDRFENGIWHIDIDLTALDASGAGRLGILPVELGKAPAPDLEGDYARSQGNYGQAYLATPEWLQQTFGYHGPGVVDRLTMDGGAAIHLEYPGWVIPLGALRGLVLPNRDVVQDHELLGVRFRGKRGTYSTHCIQIHLHADGTLHNPSALFTER